MFRSFFGSETFNVVLRERKSLRGVSFLLHAPPENSKRAGRRPLNTTARGLHVQLCLGLCEIRFEREYKAVRLTEWCIASSMAEA